MRPERLLSTILFFQVPNSVPSTHKNCLCSSFWEIQHHGYLNSPTHTQTQEYKDFMCAFFWCFYLITGEKAIHCHLEALGHDEDTPDLSTDIHSTFTQLFTFTYLYHSDAAFQMNLEISKHCFTLMLYVNLLRSTSESDAYGNS